MKKKETIFWDVDTQFDFMQPTGKLYVPGAETIIDKVSAVRKFAFDNGCSMIADIDWHSLDNEEISPRNANRFFNLKPGNYLKLSVRDSGTGISPDTLSRIFEPYFTTKKVGEGTGLGLATVHGIVQNYEGDITVESAVGKGTTFHVYLPLVENDMPGDTEKKVEIQKGTERILIVDDEKTVLEISQKMLERLGYQVTATSDSKDALENYYDEIDDDINF